MVSDKKYPAGGAVLMPCVSHTRHRNCNIRSSPSLTGGEKVFWKHEKSRWRKFHYLTPRQLGGTRVSAWTPRFHAECLAQHWRRRDLAGIQQPNRTLTTTTRCCLQHDQLWRWWLQAALDTGFAYNHHMNRRQEIPAQMTPLMNETRRAVTCVTLQSQIAAHISYK